MGTDVVEVIEAVVEEGHLQPDPVHM